IYTAPGGAVVFSAGTIFWPLGLDGSQRDPRIERMTANAFQLGVDLPVPAGLLQIEPPSPATPDPSWAGGVRTTATGMQGPAGVAARFNGPMGLAWLDATHILVADSANHAIRVVDVVTQAVTTLAGGRGGEDRDGPAASAVFFYPTGIARAPDGRIFFVASST